MNRASPQTHKTISATMSDSPAPIGTTESAPSIPQVQGRFFSARDSIAFLLASVMSFAVYLCTLAPGVTLENAGELLTASHGLGVSHPPGYPAWTLLAAIWQRIVPFHNIAWRVNLMCAFFGALAVGLLALLISKSGRLMASRCGFLQGRETGAGLDWIILASSVSAAGMLAVSPVMWSQSVITEVWTLNVFLLVAILVLVYRWSLSPNAAGGCIWRASCGASASRTTRHWCCWRWRFRRSCGSSTGSWVAMYWPRCWRPSYWPWRR